jgi:hypothetical protein
MRQEVQRRVFTYAIYAASMANQNRRSSGSRPARKRTPGRDTCPRPPSGNDFLLRNIFTKTVEPLARRKREALANCHSVMNLTTNWSHYIPGLRVIKTSAEVSESPAIGRVIVTNGLTS